jgi:hypothetical protein
MDEGVREMDGQIFDSATGEIAAAPGMPPAIAAAILAVKKQVKALGSDERNEHGRYNFVSVDKFYERIGKLMAEAGLALLIDETSTEVRASDKSGNPWLFAQYLLSFMHETGAMSAGLRRSIALPISGPQAFGAAQSYIEKQFLRQVFKVPTGEKDADDTPTDGVAPESRSGARQTQGSAPAARTAHQRQQAAPEHSVEQQEARKRYGELRAAIDASLTVGKLEEVDGCPAWVAWEKLTREQFPGQYDVVVEQLRDRIAKRRDMLLGNNVGGGY